MLLLFAFFLVDDCLSNSNSCFANRIENHRSDSLKVNQLLDSLKIQFNRQELDSAQLKSYDQLLQQIDRQQFQNDSITNQHNMPVVKPKDKPYIPSAVPDSTSQYHLLIKDKSPQRERVVPKKDFEKQEE